jgi:GPH family glycoside/pentoside/hexuronide:cation symporter
MKKLPHAETASEDKLSWGQRLAYGSGNAALNFSVNAPKALVPPIFQMTLGLNPALVGIALAIPRFWDAFTDPLMGSISDNTRTRWGRRRPFIFAGAILSGLAFAGFLAVPEGLSDPLLLAYLIGGMLILYTCSTVFGVPWYSMLPELTPDHHERTRISAVASFMSKLSGIAIQWSFAFTQMAIFTSTLVGARVLGLVGALIIISMGIIPAIFCREKFYKLARKQNKEKIIPAIKEALKNRNFRRLTGIQLFFLLGLMMTNSLGMYVMVYYAYAGDMVAGSVLTGWVGTANHIIGALSLPVVVWLSTHIGKRGAMAVCMICVLFGAAGYWFLLTPEHPYLFLITTLFYGPGLTCPFMLVPSMLTDVIDEDELKSGMRREALYGSVLQWINKLGVSTAFFFSGFILALSGFDETLGGSQSEGTFIAMRGMLVAIPAVCIIVSLWLLKQYSISGDRAYAIRSELEERRGKV